MITKMRLIVAPVALIFGIGAMLTARRKRAAGRETVIMINADVDECSQLTRKTSCCGSMLRRKRGGRAMTMMIMRE